MIAIKVTAHELAMLVDARERHADNEALEAARADYINQGMSVGEKRRLAADYEAAKARHPSGKHVN